jgi:hypothetical protein
VTGAGPARAHAPSRPSLVALATLAALASASAPRPARADGTDRCVAAAERGQDQRDRAALLEARKSFRACAADECPAPLRKDCAHWLDAVEDSLPTVVLGARDARGADLLGVHVFIDGDAIVEHDTGRAIAFDPGPHLVRFERAAAAPVELTVVLRMGDHNRAVIATFVGALEPRPASSPIASRTPLPAVAESPLGPPSPHVSPWAYVLGGVGVAGVGAFAVLAATGLAEKDHLRATCAPTCSDAEVAPLRARYIAADVSLGAGVVALLASGYLFLRAPPASTAPSPMDPAKRASADVRIDASPTRGGAMIGLWHSF